MALRAKSCARPIELGARVLQLRRKGSDLGIGGFRLKRELVVIDDGDDVARFDPAPLLDGDVADGSGDPGARRDGVPALDGGEDRLGFVDGYGRDDELAGSGGNAAEEEGRQGVDEPRHRGRLRPG